LGSLLQIGNWHNSVVSQSGAREGRGNLEKSKTGHRIRGNMSLKF
jgi:hypothetical protein